MCSSSFTNACTQNFRQTRNPEAGSIAAILFAATANDPNLLLLTLSVVAAQSFARRSFSLPVEVVSVGFQATLTVDNSEVGVFSLTAPSPLTLTGAAAPENLEGALIGTLVAQGAHDDYEFSLANNGIVADGSFSLDAGALSYTPGLRGSGGRATVLIDRGEPDAVPFSRIVDARIPSCRRTFTKGFPRSIQEMVISSGGVVAIGPSKVFWHALEGDGDGNTYVQRDGSGAGGRILDFFIPGGNRIRSLAAGDILTIVPEDVLETEEAVENPAYFYRVYRAINGQLFAASEEEEPLCSSAEIEDGFDEGRFYLNPNWQAVSLHASSRLTFPAPLGPDANFSARFNAALVGNIDPISRVGGCTAAIPDPDRVLSPMEAFDLRVTVATVGETSTSTFAVDLPGFAEGSRINLNTASGAIDVVPNPSNSLPNRRLPPGNGCHFLRIQASGGNPVPPPTTFGFFLVYTLRIDGVSALSGDGSSGSPYTVARTALSNGDSLVTLSLFGGWPNQAATFEKMGSDGGLIIDPNSGVISFNEATAPTEATSRTITVRVGHRTQGLKVGRFQNFNDAPATVVNTVTVVHISIAAAVSQTDTRRQSLPLPPFATAAAVSYAVDRELPPRRTNHYPYSDLTIARFIGVLSPDIASALPFPFPDR